LLPATILLSTLTAVSLLATAVSIQPAGPARATGAANLAAVRRFYDAVNDVIATGDAGSLTVVLSPDYREADDAGGLVPGRDPLERSLLALHETVPELRLQTMDLFGDGDRVLAVVRADEERGATTFGLTLNDPLWWSPIEVFRVVGGLVAERAAIGRRPAVLEPIVQTPIGPPPVTQGIVTVARVTLEPGGWLREPRVHGVRVLVVAAGTLEVSVAPDGSSAGSWDGIGRTLEAGDWLVVPSGEMGSGYAARNGESATTVYLEVRLAADAARSVATAPIADGAATQVMAGGQLVALPAASINLSVVRVNLLPGDCLAWSAPAGPILLWVERGALVLVTGAWAEPRIRSQTGQISRLPQAVLAAGDGALLDEGTDAEIQNVGDGSVEVMIMTLLGTPEELPAAA
jgi:hypothetical protein